MATKRRAAKPSEAHAGPTARAAAIGAGAEPDPDALAALATAEADARVRTVALARLVDAHPRRISVPVWRRAVADPDRGVRRRAAELAPRLGRSVSSGALLELLADDDPWVAEAAAYALGEHPRSSRAARTELERVAREHPDALVREAAVAALGAQGDPLSLPAVLVACDDRPAIRRRAVLALAAFDGPTVEARLMQALSDTDWQVRQAAEDLLADSDPATR